MKKRLRSTIWLGVLTAMLILFSAFHTTAEETKRYDYSETPSGDKLKKAAFEILDTKCNVCHRRQNPFMVFKEKNMEKRAKKIYKMVFVERKMPKGDEVHLTNEEYANLEKWLFTQKIY